MYIYKKEKYIERERERKKNKGSLLRIETEDRHTFGILITSDEKNQRFYRVCKSVTRYGCVTSPYHYCHISFLCDPRGSSIEKKSPRTFRRFPIQIVRSIVIVFPATTILDCCDTFVSGQRMERGNNIYIYIKL